MSKWYGADVTQVMKGMGLDPRIGGAFLQAGLGYGGSCFPKDVDSLIHTAGRLGYEFKLLRSIVEINRERAAHLVETIAKALGPLDDKTIAVLGLAFKPNTDDMREAKSLEVARLLHAAGVDVRAYDPVAIPEAKTHLNAAVRYCDSAYAVAEGSDALIVGTGWPEFRSLDFDRIKHLLKRPIIVDTKNLLDSVRLRAMGFEYVGVGRG